MIYLNQHSSYCTQAVVTEFCVKDGMHLTISDGNCTFHGKEPGTKVNVGHNWFLIDKDVYIILYAGGNADAYGVNIAICRNTAPMYINMLKKHYNQI